ncbi:MAG: hypothetical protein ABW217_06290, partial [Polyangiaceae bacterium]
MTSLGGAGALNGGLGGLLLNPPAAPSELAAAGAATSRLIQALSPRPELSATSSPQPNLIRI